jgi:YD repeat-containing protein
MPLRSRSLAVLLGLLLCSSVLYGQTIRYIYDELGRLVGVIDTNGDAATYHYDAVGNLLSITRDNAGGVSVIEFTPNAGAVGTAVTIHGIGFSATPSQNTVTFNGTGATVSAATTTSLSVTVPAGATTGAIAVTSPNGSDSSATSFVVGSAAAPTITGFTPSIGVAGTAITITGTNFDAVLPNNRIALNLRSAWATAGSSTSIDTKVPVAAASGRLSVTTFTGVAVSTGDFFVAPPPFVAADVVTTDRMAIGDTKAAPVGTSNKIALVIFDAPAGERVSLKAVPGPLSSVKIYRPDLTVISSASVGGGQVLLEPPLLPDAGTYCILVDPIGTATGTTNLTLYDVPADFQDTVTPSQSGASKAVPTSVPGQNGIVTFTGTADQRVSVKVSSFSPLGTVSLRQPGGSIQSSVTSGVAATFMDTQVLASAGTYSVNVDPHNTATGTTTLTVYDVPADTQGTVTINGSAVAVSLGTPGQNGSLTFSGTQGQDVTVQMTNNTIGTSGIRGSTTVQLLKPDGSALTSTTSSALSFSLTTQTLPTTGTYTIVVDPQGAHTGGINVGVTNP